MVSSSNMGGGREREWTVALRKVVCSATSQMPSKMSKLNNRGLTLWKSLHSCYTVRTRLRKDHWVTSEGGTEVSLHPHVYVSCTLFFWVHKRSEWRGDWRRYTTCDSFEYWLLNSITIIWGEAPSFAVETMWIHRDKITYILWGGGHRIYYQCCFSSLNEIKTSKVKQVN